jgi:hypothetical protein
MSLCYFIYKMVNKISDIRHTKEVITFLEICAYLGMTSDSEILAAGMENVTFAPQRREISPRRGAVKNRRG